MINDELLKQSGRDIAARGQICEIEWIEVSSISFLPRRRRRDCV